MGENREIAECATIQSFLNSYLRETGNYRLMENVSEMTKAELECLENVKVQRLIRSSLNKQGMDLILPLRYWSETGRHLFHFPIYYAVNEKLLELDYVTMVSLIMKELSLSANGKVNLDELMLRVILSKQNIEGYVAARSKDEKKLFGRGTNFIEAEQSLIFGHMLHPTPKSRQGITEDDEKIYAPELEGRFPLHYFRAHDSIVREASSLSENTTALIKDDLLNDPDVDDDFKSDYCKNDDYSLIPIHPLQADFLLRKPKISQLMQQGLLEYLGPHGKPFAPTSSVRTVYNETARFMYKFSLNVKITNSLRVNKLKELERGVEVNRLLDSEIGEGLSGRFPGFHIIRDPGYITLNGSLEESGFEAVLRENPFQQEEAENAMLLAGLCQDNLFGGQSRLAAII
ncbi:MAG TPA: IucA/IucC family protein, partial [Bacillales bacterium]